MLIDLFADGDDFSSETIQNNRNRYYQEKTAKQILLQNKQTIADLTSALNTHLNTAQNFTLNASSIVVLVAPVAFESLSNLSIQPLNDVKVQLPSNLDPNMTGSIRVSLLLVLLSIVAHLMMMMYS